MTEVRCGYEPVREVGRGSVARTLTVRSDLLVDLDADGRVLGVERIGDEVRFGDLCDVIRVLRADT